MDHKLMKVATEITYILPLGPYTLIYPTTKTRYMNHNDTTTRKKLINDTFNASLKSYNDTSLKCHGLDCHCISLHTMTLIRIVIFVN